MKAPEPGCAAGTAPAVLMLFIEPAPYVVAFVEAARAIWPNTVDVLYASAPLSQDWPYRPRAGDTVLPPDRAQALAEIRGRIGSGRYGLVHLAGWGHPLLWRTMLIAARRLPVTVQTDTPTPAGEALWKRVIKHILYRPLFRMPAMFVPAGTPQSAYVQSFGVPAARIRIGQLSVDVKAIQDFGLTFPGTARARERQRLGIAETDIALLYVGRLEPNKGIDDLLAAFALLNKRCPNAVLVVAGDGSMRGKIAAAASGGDRVRYLGHLTGDAVWRAYAIADLLVLPSRFEPWGLVVNEAMAAGLPVVVTDRVGCRTDLVREGATGLTVPARSPEALCAAIAALCEDTAARSRIGAEARRLISEWTLENQARNTAAAWRQVLAA